MTFFKRLSEHVSRAAQHGDKMVRVKHDDLAELLHHFARLDRDARAVHNVRAGHEPLVTAYTRAYQEQIATWVVRYFGRSNMGLKERATRLLEEALELAQAEGVELPVAARLVDSVYRKPVSDDADKEAGAVGLCLLAWAAGAEKNAWQLIAAEVARVEKISPEAFRDRHRIKAGAGVAMPGISNAIANKAVAAGRWPIWTRDPDSKSGWRLDPAETADGDSDDH